MNPVPPIPMLSGKGSGKVLLVIGVLVALAVMANKPQTTASSTSQS